MKIDFEKENGLVPVVIQDATTKDVLMLGYMNQEAFEKTIEEKRVIFYSRSKQRLWTKGESSGNYLELIDYKIDCDQDTILMFCNPAGPVCHKGTNNCFNTVNEKGFVFELEQIIQQKIDGNDPASYTNTLSKRGIHKVAQKLGEEAVELVIEAMRDQDNLFKNEAADLLYHYLILLKAKNFTLSDIEKVLMERNG